MVFCTVFWHTENLADSTSMFQNFNIMEEALEKN